MRFDSKKALKISIGLTVFTGVSITLFIALLWISTEEMSTKKAFKIGMGIMAFYATLVLINLFIGLLASREDK